MKEGKGGTDFQACSISNLLQELSSRGSGRKSSNLYSESGGMDLQGTSLLSPLGHTVSIFPLPRLGAERQLREIVPPCPKYSRECL